MCQNWTRIIPNSLTSNYLSVSLSCHIRAESVPESDPFRATCVSPFGGGASAASAGAAPPPRTAVSGQLRGASSGDAPLRRQLRSLRLRQRACPLARFGSSSLGSRRFLVARYSLLALASARLRSVLVAFSSLGSRPRHRYARREAACLAPRCAPRPRSPPLARAPSCVPRASLRSSPSLASPRSLKGKHSAYASTSLSSLLRFASPLPQARAYRLRCARPPRSSETAGSAGSLRWSGGRVRAQLSVRLPVFHVERWRVSRGPLAVRLPVCAHSWSGGWSGGRVRAQLAVRPCVRVRAQLSVSLSVCPCPCPAGCLSVRLSVWPCAHTAVCRI